MSNRIESNRIESNSDITETERERLIKSRLGQGKFRADLLNIEHSCRVTGVSNPTHLVACHTKPWRDSDNHERNIRGRRDKNKRGRRDYFLTTLNHKRGRIKGDGGIK